MLEQTPVMENELETEELQEQEALTPTEEPSTEETPAEETPAEETPAEEAPAEEVPAEETPAEETPADEVPADPTRKPYHERYYLLFGGEAEPETMNIPGALDLLRTLGYGNNSLEQSRKGMSEIENLEKNFVPDRPGSRFCDFCGKELFGSEYEILADGRERCTTCSRTAVKTEKEFKQIYADVIRNMSMFFGISINAPVDIKMVNAKALHKHLGKTFIPSGDFDGRTLGVAIRDKKNNYSILLENGAPRLSATMTMVHELTHIWQYLNWDAKQIQHTYGKKMELEVYEGMSKWVEIQYAYLINERQTAKREEILTCMREDPYGYGFIKYTSVYPLSRGSRLLGDTPFNNVEKPL